MQTKLADFISGTTDGRTADAILRKCVHCGFCTATCPTYQLLGDELDGPRGRIYLIKQLLEGTPAGPTTRTHLDRCLTCRSCETTCPSGVRYARLLDIGREVIEQRAPRPLTERLARAALRNVLAYRNRFTPLFRLGRLVRPALPERMRRQIPPPCAPGPWPAARHARRMLILDGCVQPAMAPQINAVAARVLDRLGISLVRVPQAGCCGAVSHHLSAPAQARRFMRRNIDAWWPPIQDGVEALVITASACALMVKEYAEHLAGDPAYAHKAERISQLTRDLSEVVRAEDLSALSARSPGARVAFHAPCTLQHGQELAGTVESVLRSVGYELVNVPDAHLCCGSAGSYSLLQRELSSRLLANKLTALTSDHPDLVATANIGCHAHLLSRSVLPVKHWIELIEA